jgi:hypothetical protein
MIRKAAGINNQISMDLNHILLNMITMPKENKRMGLKE